MMGANTKLGAMPDKLPNIKSTNRGFHGFNGPLQPNGNPGNQLSIEQVEIKIKEKRRKPDTTVLPGISNAGILANQNSPKSPEPDSRKASRQKTFLTSFDEDEDYERTVEGISRLASHDEETCTVCAVKLRVETEKLQDVIREMELERDRNKQEYDTTKRKLDNTSKELKTSQAMISTLKEQNQDKANKIAKLTREATIGLWNREKKKLLQFADVREASLEFELKSLQDTSRDFKDRSLDRIAFLHDQVARLKLQLNMRKGNNQNKAIETMEKKLQAAKEEMDKQREDFFAFRKDMVGLLGGLSRDFGLLQNHIDPDTQEADLDYFPGAEQFERMLKELHKSAVCDNLGEVVGNLPEKFAVSDAQKSEMMSNRRRDRTSDNLDISMPQDTDSLSEADILKKLENIEHALQESSKEIEEYDENMTDINDSGISLNDYEGRSTRFSSRAGSRGYHDNNARTEKNVRFEDTRSGRDSSQAGKQKGKDATKTSEKSVQTDLQDSSTSENVSPSNSRRGKRNRKSRSREKPVTPESKKPPSPRRKPPKKIDASTRLKQEQKQKQWLESQGKTDNASSTRSQKRSPDSKTRQNNMTTFTHIREMYSERRIHNLIDRKTGAVNVELAASQFTNLSRAGILEGFTHFVQYDSNNDYKLDMDEVVRAISRATDEVVDSEEIKAALFELGVLETDELDFFDFLCIQETLATGTFDKSKSNVLRTQVMNMNKNSSVSKYCAVM